MRRENCFNIGPQARKSRKRRPPPRLTTAPETLPGRLPTPHHPSPGSRMTTPPPSNRNVPHGPPSLSHTRFITTSVGSPKPINNTTLLIPRDSPGNRAAGSAVGSLSFLTERRGGWGWERWRESVLGAVVRRGRGPPFPALARLGPDVEPTSLSHDQTDPHSSAQSDEGPAMGS